MGLKNILGGTADAVLLVDASEILGANATSSSAVYDLGSDQPARFRVRVIVVGCDVAANSAVIINVMGSSSSTFASDVTTLGGSLVLGNAAAVATNFFVQNSNARGVGEYVIDCTNQAIDDTSGQRGVQYIRITAKTIGTTSALIYAAQLERAPMHS